MSFDDLRDDDFVEIERFTAKPNLDLTMRCVRLGRQHVPRVQFTFRPAVLAEIGGPRYAVAFAPAKKLFRIKSSTTGEFEPIRAGRGDKVMIRCRLPEAGFRAADGVAEPEFYVDAVGKVILVETPDLFLPAPVKALPPPAAKQPVQPAAVADPVLMATLGLTPTFPRRIGEVDLSPAEAAILEVLYRRDQASKDALMMATAPDPDDDRDPKLIDVYIHKLRKKLEPYGIEIEVLWGEGYRIPQKAKLFLAKVIGEAR